MIMELSASRKVCCKHVIAGAEEWVKGGEAALSPLVSSRMRRACERKLGLSLPRAP